MAQIEARPVSDSQVTMTEVVLPVHTNAIGSIFGGVVMSWIDVAAAVSAQRHSRSVVVTACIDDLHFIAPIFKGWVVTIKSCVNRAFSTSMEVGVRVDAENLLTGECVHTATAYVTFVALDSSGKPKKVPVVLPQNADEVRRYENALIRRDNRLKHKALAKQK